MPRKKAQARTEEELVLDTDYLILVTLEDWSQGLRFGELLSLVREGKPGFATRTLTNRLKELQKRWQHITQDSATKRYLITDRGMRYLREAHPIRDIVNHAHVSHPLNPFRDRLPSAYGAMFAQVRGFPPISQFATEVPTDLFKKIQSRETAFLPDLSTPHFQSMMSRWVALIFKPLIEAKGTLMPQLSRELKQEVQRLREGEVKDEDLDRIWRKIFPSPHRLVVAEQMDTEELLAWIKSTEGHSEVLRAVSEAKSQ